MTSSGNTPSIQFDPEVGKEVDQSKERFFEVDGQLVRVFPGYDEDLQPNTHVEFFDDSGDVEETVEVERIFQPEDREGRMAHSCVVLALERLDG